MNFKKILALSAICLSTLVGCNEVHDVKNYDESDYTFNNPDVIKALDYEPQAPAGINIDGKKQESVYKNAENISFSYNAREGGTQTMSLDVAFLDEGLLFYAYRDDTRIYCCPNEDVDNCYQDSIEIYIDPIISDEVMIDFLQIRLSPSGRVDTWIGSQTIGNSYKWCGHVVPVRHAVDVNGTVIYYDEQDIEENYHSVGVGYELYVPNSSLNLQSSPEKIKVLAATVDANGLQSNTYTWRSYNGIDNPEAEFYYPISNPNFGDTLDPLSSDNTGWVPAGVFNITNNNVTNKMYAEVKRSLRYMLFRFIYVDKDGNPVPLGDEKLHKFSIYLDAGDTRLSPGDSSPTSYAGEEDIFNYLKDETDYRIDVWNEGTITLYNYPKNSIKRIGSSDDFKISNYTDGIKENNILVTKIDLVKLGHLTSEAIGFSLEYRDDSLRLEGEQEYTFSFKYSDSIISTLNVCEYLRIDQANKLYRFPNNNRIYHLQNLQSGTAPTNVVYGSRLFDVYIIYFEDYFTLYFKTQDGESFHKDYLYNLEVHVDVMDMIEDVPDTKYVIMNWSNPVCDCYIYSDNTGNGYAEMNNNKFTGHYAVNSYCMSYPYTFFETSTGEATDARMLRFQMATACYAWNELNIWKSTELQFNWWNGTGMMSYKGTTDGKNIELNQCVVSSLYGEDTPIGVNKSGISLVTTENEELKTFKMQGQINELVKVEEDSVLADANLTRLSLSYGGITQWNSVTKYGKSTNKEAGMACEWLLNKIDTNNVDNNLKTAFLNAYNSLSESQQTVVGYRYVPVSSDTINSHSMCLTISEFYNLFK